MSPARWLCHGCGERFAVPAYSISPATLPLKASDDDPSLPRGQVIKYYCPKCGSNNLAGAANPDPLTPIKVKI